MENVNDTGDSNSHKPEEEWLLWDDDKLVSQLIQIQQLDVDIVNVYLSSLNLSQSEQTLKQA